MKTIPSFIHFLFFIVLSVNSYGSDRIFYKSVNDSNDDYDGQLVPYVDLGFGLSVHVLPDSDEGATSRLIKTGLGVQWLPFISTQLGLWHWSDDGRADDTSTKNTANDSEASDSVKSKERPTFEGLSASLEVIVQWPLSSQYTQLSYGPYYKYGRHCWSGVVSGLLQPWSKEGCSDIQSAGFTFPSNNRRSGDLVLYLEYSQSTLENLSSRSVQIGAKLPL